MLTSALDAAFADASAEASDASCRVLHPPVLVTEDVGDFVDSLTAFAAADSARSTVVYVRRDQTIVKLKLSVLNPLPEAAEPCGTDAG